MLKYGAGINNQVQRYLNYLSFKKFKRKANSRFNIKVKSNILIILIDVNVGGTKGNLKKNFYLILNISPSVIFSK